MTNKQRLNEVRISFLKSFFEKDEGYEIKEVNGFWLVKYWDGNFKRWWVAVYTKESYESYKLRGKNPNLPMR